MSNESCSLIFPHLPAIKGVNSTKDYPGTDVTSNDSNKNVVNHKDKAYHNTMKNLRFFLFALFCTCFLPVSLAAQTATAPMAKPIAGMMPYLHIFMAILSVWRITELFTQDRITEKLRKKWPTYLWQCPRCMSVWGACFATVAFAVFPWANWPFALAWIYLWHNETVLAKRLAERGRKLLIEVDQNGVAKWQNEFNQQEMQRLFNIVMSGTAGPVNGKAESASS